MLTFEHMRNAHSAATQALDAAVQAVPADHFAAPTPCSDWAVADLLAHQQGQNHGFALAIEEGDAPVDAFAPQPWDSERWQTGSARLVSAFAAADPQAQVVLREVGPGQAIPLPIVLSMHLADTIIHHWDLATALGESYTPEPDAVEATWEILSQVPDGGPRGETGASFALRVPSTDDNQWHQALALSGRDPQWSRPTQTGRLS